MLHRFVMQQSDDVSNAPVDLLHWLLALLPILVLLVLLAVLRWKAPQAGPVGLAVAVAVALLAFRTPLETLAVASGKGVWDAFFILLVIWPALVLYRVTDAAGAFDALRRGIARFSTNDMFLVLAFGWVFASFLQGIAGFGTPIAVVAPLLVAIGVQPVMAVVIPLIGHAWANMFGTLGVSWLATNQVIDIDNETATAVQTALLLWIPNLLGGLFIAWLVGRGAGLMHALPLVAVISLIHGGGQLALSSVSPVLSNFLPATAAMVAVVAFTRWSRYAEDAGFETCVMQSERKDESDREPVMGLSMALLPYIALTVVSVIGLAISPVERTLDRVEVGLAMPATETGYDIEEDAEDPYSPLSPFTHPGFFLVLSTVLAGAVYRAKGYYRQWREVDEEERRPVWSQVVVDAMPASVAVVSFLVLSSVMGHSGQTDSLALGVAEVAPAGVYAFVAAWIGVLGAFMTSSNTASNVLFAPLQETIAEVEGLPEAALIAAQSAGGAIGNAVAPANIVLGTGTTGSSGQEGQVLRRTLPWTVVTTLAVGAVTLVLTTL
jgi:lactate permease